MKKSRALLCMLAFVFVTVCLASAASAAMSAKKAEHFVDATWLAANLDKVKAGDTIAISYIEAVNIAVTKKAKRK